MKPTTKLLLALTIALALASIRASAADPYAKAVIFARILEGNNGNNYTNAANALGPADGNSVSLGGPGGSIILDMGADTPVVDGPGMDLEVRESGAAFGGVDESYRVLVSNSTETNSFIFIAVGRALSLIDIHSSGLTSARYVWLQDIATETLNTKSPGSDIDSLRALFYAGGGDVAPPSNVQVRLIGQGVWLSWTPSTATNVTGTRSVAATTAWLSAAVRILLSVPRNRLSTTPVCWWSAIISTPCVLWPQRGKHPDGGWRSWRHSHPPSAHEPGCSPWRRHHGRLGGTYAAA
ncbi:MAG: hypothetical protein PHO37_01230 [Kiritimatiellae bacterium]|nr:hypothetical protein [Kiritimatiellia bacterium]